MMYKYGSSYLAPTNSNRYVKMYRSNKLEFCAQARNEGGSVSDVISGVQILGMGCR